MLHAIFINLIFFYFSHFQISYLVFLAFFSVVAIENRVGPFDVATWITVVFFVSFLTYELRKVLYSSLSLYRSLKRTIKLFYDKFKIFKKQEQPFE